MSITIKNKEYQIIKKLKETKNEKIFQVLNKSENKYYSLKKIKFEEDMAENCEKIADILSKFNGNNNVKYYDTYKDNNKFYILTEYYEQNLRDFIDKFQNNNELIEENILSNIIRQICLGIKEIHNTKIVHRDIKPENIFMDEKMDIKIGIFGTSEYFKLKEKFTQPKSNYYYMAPEILKIGIYNQKSDMYSFGCVIYELFNLSRYYDDKMCNDVKTIPDIYDSKWQEIINSLLQIDYNKRMSINQVFDIINKIDINKLENKINKLNIDNEEKEKEKLNKMKEKIIENQKKLREKNYKNIIMTEEEKNVQINEVLENMCIYGFIQKKEIEEEKKNHPEKFIETSEVLKLEKQDEGLFALGLLALNLERLGIETAIELKENKENEDADLTSLNFITNGMINKKKYDLHFELGEKRNEELLNNENEYEKFKENLKKKLSKDYNIPKEKIIVTLPQKGSFHVQLIFQSEDFNNLNKEEFIEKFKNDKEFPELQNLKNIHEDVIMSAVKLSKNQLDPRGNRNDGWGVGEQRGGKDYFPPIGWNGIGLKVLDKYDGSDNTWIEMFNLTGEWCVAYHGVARFEKSSKVKEITGNIYKTSFKPGQCQAHEDCDDVFHPGKKVGIGVYCTPKIETAEGYSGISIINGVKYNTVLMVRVKPNLIRHCSDSEDYWVVNGTIDEIRPYRILYKKN